jgi:transcriptional regulator with XRE-family HTH domain
MDNIQFGAFVAQLRKEQELTQKELADRLNVTDKAVSKWETGKGFPDVKLLEPLAQALGVSLVELMQGRRQESETLTMAEAGAVVSQAIGQSERTTARRYLRLFRWFLTAICGLCLLIGWPFLTFACVVLTSADFLFGATPSGDLGVIGGADGPTAIITASAPSSTSLFWMVGILLILLAVCIVLAVKVWRLEKKLK